MMWKCSKDEKPPKNKHVLLCRKVTDYACGGKKNSISWFRAYIYKPFDENEEYNPSLYKFSASESPGTDHILRDHHYWLEIEPTIKIEEMVDAN